MISARLLDRHIRRTDQTFGQCFSVLCFIQIKSESVGVLINRLSFLIESESR
jgi:hypothetical protein